MQFAEKNSGQLFHDHPHLELSSNKDLNTHSGFLAKLHDQVHGHSLDLKAQSALVLLKAYPVKLLLNYCKQGQFAKWPLPVKRRHGSSQSQLA